jgi:Carboxypeptidase regulatory-like domain/TonB-dependent Receptor Plug Domain
VRLSRAASGALVRRLALVLVLVFASQRGLAAQGDRDTTRAFGTIDGIVRDTALTPLAGASVTILSTSVRVETGPSGRFRITRILPGQYLLIVRHLGHRPASGIIDVAANDTARLSYTLEPAVVMLDSVVVTEQRLTPSLLEFEQRRRLGFGTFVTQSEIDRRNSVFTAELLRDIPSLRLTPVTRGGGPSTYTVDSSRLGSCRMELFVDGVRLPERSNTDDLPPPKEIAGIEVYAGPATIPLQYAGGRATCGVVLMWTRHGT